MKTLLIYGATGYTGRMAAERAKALGLQFEIAGVISPGSPPLPRNCRYRFAYLMQGRGRRHFCLG